MGPAPGAADAPPGGAGAPAGSDASLPDAYVQLFVNVGMREGLRAADLQRLLADAGVTDVDVGGIRVRDRMTFVRIRKDALDRAVASLSGQVIGGRTVVAELARGRT